MWRRQLFQRGYRWKIGNDKLTQLDCDPWIPRKGCRTPIIVPPSLKGRNVDFLIPKLGRWNEELTNECFLQVDVEDILQMQLPRCQYNDDHIIWDLKKRGSIYS